MRLATHIVEKLWGRTGLAPEYGVDPARRIGEIWFEAPAGIAAPGVLIKYLFTSERLSIQVHPNDAQARAAGHPCGKEEMWIVLAADAGAHIGIGLVDDFDADTLRAAALDGSIEGMIDWRGVQAGDIYYNPAGTIHAIGPGVVVAEVQQAVDVTYRLYDYGRPRELHLDAGLAVAHGTRHADPRDGRLPESGSAVLVDGPHFGVAWADGTMPAGVPADRAVQVLPVSGAVAVDGVAVPTGGCGLARSRDTVTIPADTRAIIAWDMASA